MDHGVPTWEISKKAGTQGEWIVIAKGIADSFEAAKAAALFEAESSIAGAIISRRVVKPAATDRVGRTRTYVFCAGNGNP
jgi:hypothetical protein